MNRPTERVLFSPYVLKNLVLKNRVVMAPMTRNQSPNFIPTAEVAEYYRKRAEGGAGLLITECTFIDHPVANSFNDAPAFYGDEALAGWHRVVKEVHGAGGKIIPQLWHAGSLRNIGTKPNASMKSVAPMDVFENGHQLAKGMSKIEIQDVINAFTKSAINAKKLGFDGVEIHGAHGYLIDQFLWKKSNQRTDEYGGNIENRVRFACQIINSIRKSVGEDFPIIFRFSQWKLSDYDAKIAQNISELEDILIPLVKAGVDAFHVSTRRFWEPAFEGSELSLAGWTKKITGKPVIAVGNVGIDKEFSLNMFSGDFQSQPKSVELLEKKLQEKEFDLIAVGRAILADPEWPNKIEAGELDKIIPFSSKSLSTL